MGEILSVFMFGLSFGVVLFLLAAGLTLTMGLMRVINLAHGALYMIGGYVGLSVAGHAHNYWVGVLAGAVCAGLIGLLLEVGFLRRLYRHPTSQVLLTIGFIYIIQNVTMWIWGSYPSAQLAPSIFSGSLPIGSVDIPVFRVVIIGFGLVMALLLWLLQDKTRIGAVVRAGMDNREIAGALGINLKGVFTGIFVLGAFVAGMIGLVGSTAATGINLGVAWDALLLSMIVVVVGGTGSIQGALVGGITIGLLNAFGAAYFPDFAHFVSYVALIIILLIRPGGLLGRQMATGAAAVQYLEGRRVRRGEWWTAVRTSVLEGLGRAAAPPRLDRVEKDTLQAVVGEAPKWRVVLHKWLPYAVVLVVLLVVPAFLGTYDQSILTKVIIFALFALSLDLTMGYAGLVSFGHAAFLGVAGYVVGIFSVNLGISSFWLVALIALAITAAVAAIIGYISLRVSGVYYLLVTMGLGQVLSIIALKWDSVTNGMDGLTGISKPDLGFDFHWTNLRFYYFVFVIFIICYAILRRIVGSSFGRTLAGVRLNEQRMRSLGFNTWSLKYVGVIVGGIFAGVAGILYAYNYGNMMPEYVALQTSSLPMLMVILGGAGTLWGPCLGAAAIILMQEYIGVWGPLKERWPLILGVIFVACVMLLRGGFARYLSRAWGRWGPLRVRSAGMLTAGGKEVEP
jgi:branched-chain amino acid transport system permease protein